MRRVVVTNPLNNIYTMQVCAKSDVDDEEILKVCDSKNPAGTTDGWARVIRADNKHGQGPVTCSDHPDRTHFLVTC